MVVVRALKDIISIKIKSRHDGFCDQYNRLFMTKMLLIASVIMGFDYFSDRVACVTSKTDDGKKLSEEYVHSVCWISGFYIYKEMTNHPQKCDYYGIPRFFNCGENDDTCEGDKPMTRVYYLHYQWMPFYIGSLAVFFYAPYIVFRLVNTDLISLNSAIKSVSGERDLIVENYFNYKLNTLTQLRLRVWWNVMVKALYVFFSLATFYLTDRLLMGKYLTYGKDYLTWSELNVTMQHAPVTDRKHPKIGNVLLPSMGLCDIYAQFKDRINTHRNKHTLLCEISPNVLYQYVLMVLWFFFVGSVIISIGGFVCYIISHLCRLIFYCQISAKKTVYRNLTLREIEYLEFIKKKNMMVYGDVLRKLKQIRCDLRGKLRDDYESSFCDGKTMYQSSQYYNPVPKEDVYMFKTFDSLQRCPKRQESSHL